MEGENSESKEVKLREDGKDLQNRITKRYQIDFDPLFGPQDALDYAKWSLKWYQHIYSKEDPDSENSVEDKIHTFYEAIEGYKELKDENDRWKYLKAAIRDEGFDFMEKEFNSRRENAEQFKIGMEGKERDFPSNLGKALINLALSLPSERFD